MSTALLALVGEAGLAASSEAATYTVGTTSDTAEGACPNPASGTCSLRQLIVFEDGLGETPNPFDVIVVPAGSYSLTQGELVITQSLAIIGAGARTTHVLEPASAERRVFKIEPPGSGSTPSVVITGLEISGGTATASNGSFGGDVYNAGETILQEDWITEGHAESGGGITNNAGTLAVDRSLVSNNHASQGGADSGGIQNHGTAGAPGKKADLVIEDSTVADNDARLGAGIFSWSDEPDGNEVVLLRSTIVGNTTQEELSGPARGPGAGLLVTDGTAEVAGSLFAANDEIAGNTTTSNCSFSSPGTIASLGYNLETGTECGFTATGDLQETFPQFGPDELHDNGGNTDTFALEPTSPGVDAIPTSFPFCGGADQRGVTRPQGNGCDIGAVELAPLTIDATEGSQFSARVATRPTCGIETHFTPVVEWGDGSTSAGTFEENGEKEVIGVRGTHDYAEEGTYKGTVTFENDCGRHTVAFLARVADAPLSATGVAVSGTALTPLTAVVATFTDADPGGAPPDYTASIDWGDGTVSAGTITPAPGGGFVLTGSHTYAAGGVYPTAVVINDVGGASATAASSAIIANPPPGPPTLTASPPTVTASTSAAFTTTVNPHGLPTSVHFEYGPVLGAAAAAITYGSSTPAQVVGSDYTNHTVTATVTGLLPNVTYHWRAVATNSAGSVQGADQTLVTPADPPPPPPVLGKSANVSPVSGVVFIELPAGAKLSSLVSPDQAFAALSKGQGFIPLTEARQIPVGSILDTSAGVARITTATATKGKLQNGDFGAGIFKLLQQRKQRGLTELDIMNNRSPKKVCATLGKKAAVAAKLSSKVLGRIHGSAHGRFVTKGQYSAATVRGTIWSVSNQCNGTLTKVTRDVVTVRDFRRRKTITLHSGQSYLAKAPG